MAKKKEEIKYTSINIEGTDYKTLLSKKFETRKGWENPNPKKIVTTIPGTILDICVRRRQKVKEGDVLIILEAMKMRNKIISPVDGKVKMINVKKGDSIAKGTLLIELE